MARTHWCGEDVATMDTTLAMVPAVMPVFERQPFGRNRFHDMIVRRSVTRTDPLPIGTVSKKYILVQHADAVHAVIAEVERAGIDTATVPARLLISEYGTRIALRATLPSAYAVTPADGLPMALTFECFNSVDGTVPLFAAVGWFRFVCSNGLIVGTTSATVRRRHSPPLEIGEIAAVLADGVAAAVEDPKSFALWSSTGISDANLAGWVDGPVAEAWGPLAAARVYAIATTGVDGIPVRRRRNAPPHRWSLTEGTAVPGTDARCEDGYAVAQVLAWVAARRGDVAQRLQWRAQIRTLMSHLVPAPAS
jgi:hypothetical protein